MINLNHVCHQSWIELLASQIMVQSEFLTLDDNHRYILITRFSKEQRKRNHNQNQHMQHMYCHNKNWQWMKHSSNPVIQIRSKLYIVQDLTHNSNMRYYFMSIFMQKSSYQMLKRLNNERKEFSAFNNLFLQTRCFHIKFSSSDIEDALFLSA